MGESIIIGQVTGTRVNTTRSGKGKAQFVKARFTTRDDVRELQYSLGPGIDAAPANGARVLYIDSGGNLKFVVGGSDVITPTANPGDFEIYSTDGSAKKGRIKAKANGKLYLANEAVGNLRDALDSLANAIITFSSATSTSAITAGGATSPSLAAALVTLLSTMNASLTAAKSSIDAILDVAP